MQSPLPNIARPLRINPAFDDREEVLELIRSNSPYPALGRDLPDGVADTEGKAAGRADVSILPWFRGQWAVGGRARIAGAESVLHNDRFIKAARAIFGARVVRPRTVVVNLSAPMPAGAPHLDIPSFRGATREHYPLRFLAAMGASRLFERWRSIEAGAVSWFYDGAGGAFDYWPDGPAGSLASERPPFGNVAIVADNDRMYHRIGEVGPPGACPPKLPMTAQIRADASGTWVVEDRGLVFARYAASEVRLSVLWKAEVFIDSQAEKAAQRDRLDLDQVIDIITHDLRARKIEFDLPADPVHDPAWHRLLDAVYVSDPFAEHRLNPTC